MQLCTVAKQLPILVQDFIKKAMAISRHGFFIALIVSFNELKPLHSVQAHGL